MTPLPSLQYHKITYADPDRVNPVEYPLPVEMSRLAVGTVARESFEEALKKNKFNQI